MLEKKIWNRQIAGLLLTTAVALVVANLFDLSSISVMGSAGFLLIFAAVNVANAVLHKRTGGNRVVSIVGAAVCLAALAALIWHVAGQNPNQLWVLAAMVGLSLLIEFTYRAATGREIKAFHPRGK